MDETTAQARVLLVDDEEAVRESTAAILRLAGFDVLTAADTAAATWVLADEDIDVLLLDLRLGHHDGRAVLHALEESAAVILFSGFADVEETDIRREFGPVIFDSLRKPVPPDRLVAVVTAAAVHARRPGHELRVRPITPRKALRLALAGLSRLSPDSDRPGGPADPSSPQTQ
jgi:DNA-binding NtrC family response regulator